LLRLNNELFEQTTGDCFVSMLYGIWDDGARTFRYANGGHEPPLRVGESGAALLPRGGIALGAIDEVENYLTEEAVQLAPTDTLLLYTDGVHEAMNGAGEMYGMDRLLAAAARAAAGGDSLVAALRDDLSRFVADTEQHDDITLVALRAR
jgi:sigma-B regulation protein RsbU (phosphoserine phosphatase)